MTSGGKCRSIQESDQKKKHKNPIPFHVISSVKTNSDLNIIAAHSFITERVIELNLGIEIPCGARNIGEKEDAGMESAS